MARNLRQVGASDKPRGLDAVRLRRGGAQDAFEHGAGLEPKGRQITVKLQRDGGLAVGPDGSIYARVDGTILTLERGVITLDLVALAAVIPIKKAADPGATAGWTDPTAAAWADDLRDKLQAAGLMED